MPAYDIYCTKCKSFFFDEKMSFKEYDELDQRKCVHCLKNGGLKIQIHDIADFSIKDVKTIGQQAELNTKLKGKYFASEQEAKKKEQEIDVGWCGSLSPELHKKIIRNPDKKQARKIAKDYVLTGKQ